MNRLRESMGLQWAAPLHGRGRAGGCLCVSVCVRGGGAASLPPGPAQPRGKTVEALPFELFYCKQNGRIGRRLTAQEKNIFSLKKMKKEKVIFFYLVTWATVRVSPQGSLVFQGHPACSHQGQTQPSCSRLGHFL